MRDRLQQILLPMGFLLTIVALWETLVRLVHVPTYLLPAPSVILARLYGDIGSLAYHGLVTLMEAVAGFCLANISGFLLAVLFAHSRAAEKAIYPFAIALKTTPIIAMAPLLVLWLGTGLISKIVASALICFFPIVVNATRGLRRVDEEALDLFRSLAASPIQIFFKLRLPNSLPYILSALKISTSLSVVGAIVGEFVGANRGLGYLILVASYHLETDLMFAAVIVAALSGILFFATISLVEMICVPWGEPTDS